jgi:tetratricopeptide (TPR) repeat protein
MIRLPLALCLSVVAAAGQSSSSQEQQRAFEDYQRIVAAQRQFGDLNGFSSTPLCQACGPGYTKKLSPRARASFVSATTLAAPKKARKEFQKAEHALLRSPQRLDKAQAALRNAVGIYASYAAAWSLLGKIQLATGAREEARASLLHAVEADDAFLEPQADLARMHLEDRDWQALEQSGRRIVRANPNFTLGHLYLGVAFFNQGASEGAEKHALAALATEDAALFPEIHHLLGQIYESKSDRRRAAEHFRAYVEAANPPEPWGGALRERIRSLESP